MPEFLYQLGELRQSIRIDRVNDKTYQISLNDKTYIISDPEWREGNLLFSVEGQQIRCAIAQAEQHIWVGVEGETYRLSRAEPRRARRQMEASDSSQVRAAMPGTVQAILVESGAQVERGQTLLILEAMKMELRLTAPQAGIVAQILVQPGQLVEQGVALITLA